jgi:hypothetical protein
MVLLGLVASLAVVAMAQEERPQIMPGERKVQRKKDAGPRAVGVLQMAGNGKVSLVPIAILIDGKFWDASAYKADPVPMALDQGTVYEGERTGSSLGLFTVNAALHSNAVNLLSPWIATGKWLPAGSETAAPALKAETVPVGIDPGDEPPRLTRDPTKVRPASAPAPGSAPSSPPSSPSQSGAPSTSGDEPPRLTKGVSPPASNAPSGSTQAGQSKGGADSTAPKAGGGSKPGDTQAGDAKPADATADTRANLPASDSGATEANRPMLRRGKPVEPLPDDVVPGYSKPGAVASAAAPANAGKTPEAAADKAPVEIVPAISDATGPQPRSFVFEWLKGEEGERRAQMETLAKEQVRAYVEARAKGRITPKPAGPQSARRAPAAKKIDPILENVQMKAFDVWVTNQPVLVFSAEAHTPPAAGTSYSATDSDLQYSILLVAYPDIYNNLHTVYVGVTDRFHLDLTPRLELIDAVDADGDGRGELLFREIADGGSGWVIYRPTADKLWKMYDSLHPE